MQIELTASILRVRAAALAARAHRLARRAPPALRDELASIELAASNIRLALAGGLRLTDGAHAALPEFADRLSEHAARVERIENWLQDGARPEATVPEAPSAP